MAASPLRSSPPSPERTLVEFLDEKQEPFLLDVYLLENGHGTRTAEAQLAAFCWPGRARRRLAGRGLRRQGEGILRSLLPALLHCRNKRAAQEPASSVATDIAELPCTKDGAGGATEWEFMDDQKQHSPVSVLEVQSVGSDSPVHEQCTRKELLVPQRTLRQLLMSERSKKVVSWRPWRWRRHAAELSESGRLVGEEVEAGAAEWRRPWEHAGRIGAEIWEEILEGILEDSVRAFLTLPA